MPIYSLQAAVTTQAGANVFDTVLSLKFADTLGHRGRLRRLTISGGGAAPQDLQVQARLAKSDNAGDGTEGDDKVADIVKLDPLSVASNVTIAGVSYTGDPTDMEAERYGLGGLNTRATVQYDWVGDPDAPRWDRNEALNLECAPGEATAATLLIGIEWEEH